VLFILPLRVNFYHTYSFIGAVVLAVIYYYTVVVHAQTFSPEEQENFMRNYIINANLKKKQTLKARSRAQNGRIHPSIGERVSMSSDTSSQPPDPSDVSGAEISGPYGASSNSVSFRDKKDPISEHADADMVPAGHAPHVRTKSAKFALAQAGVHTILESPRLDDKEAVEEWADVEEGMKKRSKDAPY